MTAPITDLPNWELVWPVVTGWGVWLEGEIRGPAAGQLWERIADGSR